MKTTDSYGMVMQERSFSSQDYRYGFNGKEKDDETFKECVAFEYRIFDSRLCRFLSTDPLDDIYPWQTPFAYCNNSPISKLDILGLGEIINTHEAKMNEAKKHLDSYKKKYKEYKSNKANKSDEDYKDNITAYKTLIRNKKSEYNMESEAYNRTKILINDWKIHDQRSYNKALAMTNEVGELVAINIGIDWTLKGSITKTYNSFKIDNNEIQGYTKAIIKPDPRNSTLNIVSSLEVNLSYQTASLTLAHEIMGHAFYWANHWSIYSQKWNDTNSHTGHGEINGITDPSGVQADNATKEYEKLYFR